MVYNTLDILPVKTFYKVIETGDLSLLGAPENESISLWQKLREDFNKINPDKSEKTLIEIEKVNTVYQLVNFALFSLEYTSSPEAIGILADHGHKISKDSYFEDIKCAKKENEDRRVLLADLEKKLPKKTDENTNIDRVIASYSSVIGYDLGDYNTVSVTKFFAIQEQVGNKINAMKNG